MPDLICTFPDCDRPLALRGFCTAHYHRSRKGSDMDAPIRVVKPRAMSHVEWFWLGYERTEDGCLEWQRGRTAMNYGKSASIPGVGSRLAHVIAWTLTHGPVPDGLCVCHRCDNPPCGDIEHLFLGTRQENSRDMVTKGRSLRGRLLVSECVRGHEFTPENTMRLKDGRRCCRACRRIYDKRKWAKRKAATE